MMLRNKINQERERLNPRLDTIKVLKENVRNFFTLVLMIILLDITLKALKKWKSKNQPLTVNQT